MKIWSMLSGKLLFAGTLLLGVTCQAQAGAITMQYAIDRNGNVINSGDIRYYNASHVQSGAWAFDAANNRFQNSYSGGGWRTLNTTAFTVADIVDLNFVHPSGDHAWVTTTGGDHYAINRFGNIIASAPIQYYNARQNDASFWGFNAANNQFMNSLTGGWRPLNTTLFDVADIVDLTYFNPGGSHAWVTTTSGDHYAIDPYGNIIYGGASDILYFNGSFNNTWWGFDAANNLFLNTLAGGGWRPLNTTLFEVADIVDLTYYDPGGNYAWVTVVIEQGEVPVTATGLLILSGLAGIGLVGRRRAAG